METIKTEVWKRVKALLTDQDVIGKLESIKCRWDDEREYEDWADYETYMKKLWGGKEHFVKGTKRPFGFVVVDMEQSLPMHYHLKLKFTRTHVKFQCVAKVIKEV